MHISEISGSRPPVRCVLSSYVFQQMGIPRIATQRLFPIPTVKSRENFVLFHFDSYRTSEPRSNVNVLVVNNQFGGTCGELGYLSMCSQMVWRAQG